MADKVYKKIVWKVENTKEELEAFTLDKRLTSPHFEVLIGNTTTKWFLSFYPRGATDEDEDGVALYLDLVQRGPNDFKAKFTLGVVGKKGNEECNLEKLGKSFDNGDSYGSSYLLKQDDLFNLDRGYFTDGKLTLYCQLTLSEYVTDCDGHDLSKQSIASDYEKMFKDELFTDFKVETSDKKILKAHKAVLITRSSYFSGMIKGGFKENNKNVVKVPDDAIIMKAVLSFIYCGEVHNLEEIALELVFASQKYLLDGLKKMCIKSIVMNLTYGNAVDTLLATEGLIDSEDVNEKCIDLIASNFEYLSTTPDWEKIPPKVFTEIIRKNNSEIKDTMNI